MNGCRATVVTTVATVDEGGGHGSLDLVVTPYVPETCFPLSERDQWGSPNPSMFALRLRGQGIWGRLNPSVANRDGFQAASSAWRY